VLDARDPLPVAHSIVVAMGLQLGQDEARRRFAEAHRRDRLNGTACVGMVQATARKWGGTNEGFSELYGTPAPAWADFLAAAGHSPLAEASE